MTLARNLLTTIQSIDIKGKPTRLAIGDSVVLQGPDKIKNKEIIPIYTQVKSELEKAINNLNKDEIPKYVVQQIYIPFQGAEVPHLLFKKDDGKYIGVPYHYLVKQVEEKKSEETMVSS